MNASGDGNLMNLDLVVTTVAVTTSQSLWRLQQLVRLL